MMVPVAERDLHWVSAPTRRVIALRGRLVLLSAGLVAASVILVFAGIGSSRPMSIAFAVAGVAVVALGLPLSIRWARQNLEPAASAILRLQIEGWIDRHGDLSVVLPYRGDPDWEPFHEAVRWTVRDPRSEAFGELDEAAQRSDDASARLVLAYIDAARDAMAGHDPLQVLNLASTDVDQTVVRQYLRARRSTWRRILGLVAGIASIAT